jgi:2-hydroxycyclohexanecarboxyl-CoA dehydrogenase
MSRVAVVTGGASGIGLGCARALAEKGHRIALFDLRPDTLQTAVESLRQSGAEAIGCVVDVSDRTQVDAGMADTRAKLGPVQIVVTSAGIAPSKFFTEMSLDDWNRVLAVNLTGTFNTVQSAIADMLNAGWGRIVTIASTAAQTGAPDRAHYAASKGGVVGFTKAMSMEFAPKGITANTIPPSIIDTPAGKDPISAPNGIDLKRLAAMTPVRRVGTPADVGAACAFLCSDAAGFITGQQINVNGGWYLG